MPCKAQCRISICFWIKFIKFHCEEIWFFIWNEWKSLEILELVNKIIRFSGNLDLLQIYCTYFGKEFYLANCIASGILYQAKGWKWRANEEKDSFLKAHLFQSVKQNSTMDLHKYRNGMPPRLWYIRDISVLERGRKSIQVDICR